MAIHFRNRLVCALVFGCMTAFLIFSAGSATADTGNTDTAATTTFYFAEGYTGEGFQEYLCLGNPDDAMAEVEISYLFKDGSTMPGAVNIPPDSRATVDVNAMAGPGMEVSIIVTSQQDIVAERPMYFSYNGKWSGGHDTVGATNPAYLWYFAEGYTGPGFDEWICVLNPNDEAASLNFFFQTQEEGLKVETGLPVLPHSRASFLVNDLLEGGSYQTSLTLSSNLPVVAERPMYFDYAGRGNGHWQGGHCVMGASALSKGYYFAEGTTRSGFEEWLTIQNPFPIDINVGATYQLGEGQGGPVQTSYIVPANTRRTVYVPDEVGAEKDVSVYLYSSSNFLAERPMYFSYAGTGNYGWQGGHCVIGAGALSQEWFFAEGYTGPGFEQWLCIQNPSGEAATVTVEYYTQELGTVTGTSSPLVVPPDIRLTVNVNYDAGPDLQLSTRVTASADVVVERPMYFDFSGRDGGHDVVGYAR